MTKKQKYFLPVIALIVANTLWGLNTSAMKVALETIPPHFFTGTKFLIASLCILPFALRTWKPLKKADLIRFIMSSIFAITLSAYALTFGLSRTPAFNAAAIWLLGPVVLLVLCVSFLKEKISFRTFMGIVVAIAGSAIIIGKPFQGAGTADMLIGNLSILLSVFFYAIAVLLSKPLMKKASASQATFLSLFPGALPLAVYGVAKVGSFDVDKISSRSMKAFIISTIIIILANSLFYYALRYKEAHATGVYSYIDPAAKIVGAWFILNERPGSSFAFGAALILCGIYLAELHKSKRHHHWFRRHY